MAIQSTEYKVCIAAYSSTAPLLVDNNVLQQRAGEQPTQNDNDEQQIAAVHLVTEVANEERSRRSHCKEGCRNVAAQVPAKAYTGSLAGGAVLVMMDHPKTHVHACILRIVGMS